MTNTSQRRNSKSRYLICACLVSGMGGAYSRSCAHILSRCAHKHAPFSGLIDLQFDHEIICKFTRGAVAGECK